MSKTMSRFVLLQTAAVLALAAGPTFAKDGPNAVLQPAAGVEPAPAEQYAQADVPAAADDESVPDTEEGMVGQREFWPDATQASPIHNWKLGDFQGAGVYSDGGEQVGTVEAVAYDDGDDLYLVVDLSPALDPIGQGPRAIPLTEVGYHGATGQLHLEDISAATVEAMAGYGAVASGYTEVVTDAKLQSLLSPHMGTQ